MTRVLSALISVFFLATVYLSVTVSERQDVLRRIAHHNDTWAISQTVQEFMRLSLSLALYGKSNKDSDIEDIRLRSDIMISRLVSFREGTLKEFVESSDDRKRIVANVIDITEDLDHSLNSLDYDGVASLLERMNATIAPLTNLSSQSVQESWGVVENNLQSLKSLQRIFVTVVMFLILCWFGLLVLFIQRNRLLTASKKDGELLNESLNSAGDELRRKNSSLEYAAYHDPLTTLPNRTLFWNVLNEAMAAIASHGGRVSLLLIDLDEFKSVNDTLGHDAGDSLLVQVSERMMNLARKPHMLCRLGGDEFACLLLDVTKEESVSYALGIASDISAPYNLRDQRTEIGCSIGIAIADPYTVVDTQLLFKRADIALYRAKASDHSRVCTFESYMQKEFDDRKILEADLKLAVSHKMIQVVYQAQVDVHTVELTGMEALARWVHPVRGNIPPNIFIPIAEELGIIRELGLLILMEACAEAASWVLPLKISVNLSSLQLKSPDMVKVVKEVLTRTGLSPHRLELEITESVLLSNQDNVLTAINQLRSIGVKIAMDDFGTGYSSLAVLRRIPFDIIKVDKAFIRDINTDQEALALLKLVIDIGKLLGKKVVVEGIETDVQHNIIRDLGRVTGQGFLFGKPESAIVFPYLRTGTMEASACEHE